jgi:bifunctional NMN adenylyltransferase/nudix hydrolase
MSKLYDFAVVIGRFQPIHNGHITLIDHALSLAENVIICLGSANAAPHSDNPFTPAQRARMILNHYPAENAKGFGCRLWFREIDDSLYTDQEWIDNVHREVYSGVGKDSKICLCGFDKDPTSRYLKFFPEWESQNLHTVEPFHATTIREDFYKTFIKRSHPGNLRESPLTPDALYGYARGLPLDSLIWEDVELQEALEKQAFEWDFNRNYDPKKYPVSVNTADSVVICNGHVLLIKRKNIPGKGLWALPGGHMEPDETLFQAALRELREETRIDLSERRLRQYLVGDGKVFDHPKRSARARVITQAFLFNLIAETSLPDIAASDDAEKAKWTALADLDKRKMFEDHYDIIRKMVGGL